MLAIKWGIPLATAVLLAAPVGLATNAHAATSNGCVGTVATYDEAGNLVDRASAPGSGGTQADPLMVDPSGRIDWSGRTPRPITNGTWNVSTSAISRSGNFANLDKKMAKSGSADLGSQIWALPLRIMLTGGAVFRVDAQLVGAGGTCAATLFITGTGSPTGSPMWITALILLFFGMALLLWSLLGSEPADVDITDATVTAAADGSLDDILHTAPPAEPTQAERPHAPHLGGTQ